MQHQQTPFEQKSIGEIRLPSLSKNLPMLMQTMADDRLNYRQLAEIIKQYPEISARLIFLVNSPWSAPIKPITSIEDACARLGTSIVKSTSIAISVASSFDNGKCPSFSSEHFWTTSMLVADGAGFLAEKLGTGKECLEFVQTAQTAGIFHNLGLLWLADNLPKETDKALKEVSTESLLTVNEALLKYTGTDYCMAGGWIGEQLTLPDVLIAAIKYHHDINYQDTEWKLVLLVGSAVTMVAALYNQSDEIPEDSRIVQMGLNTSIQKEVFHQLSNKFEKTRELAKTLF